MEYDCVRAKSHEEARKKTKYKVGSLVKIVDVQTSANSDGTYSVVPILEIVKEKR